MIKPACAVFFIGLTAILSLPAYSAATLTIDFDSLPTLGTTQGNQSFADANGGSDTYQGVTFSNNSFRVVGDEYRVAVTPPNPTFGVPHSGHFFLANGNTPNDNVIIYTNRVLTEAWFGRNEYYGYGGGASAVSVTAFGAGGELSVSINLPDTFPYTGNIPGELIGNGLPDPMVLMDTSIFATLPGILGYRISRVELGALNGNWVADDLTFIGIAAAVPEPSTYTMLLAGLGLLGFMVRRKNTA